MSVSPVEYLRHILDETEFLTNRFREVSKEDFLTDETLKRAAVRSLEIIGEAVKKLLVISETGTAPLSGER